MVTITDIKDACATMQRLISGVKRAYVTAPASLPAGDLPAFVNLSGKKTRLPYGDEVLSNTRREIRMVLFVAPKQVGISGEAEGRADALIDRVWEYFDARPQLGGEAWVQTARLVSDSGPIVMNFAGDEYLCVEFVLQVDYWTPVDYAAGE